MEAVDADRTILDVDVPEVMVDARTSVLEILEA